MDVTIPPPVEQTRVAKESLARAFRTRYIALAVCGWVSACLLIAGWLPDVGHNMSFIWLISGATGLCAAVGLTEAIKGDVKIQERLLTAYIHAATTDSLTELSNRQSLDSMLTSLLSTPALHRPPISMVMIDIDHFKAFNDQWGHQAGDVVLHNVAGKLRRFFGEKAFVARYGGEEFAIVLSNCGIGEAGALAENCREMVKAVTCPYRDHQFRVTISGGVSEARSQDTLDTLTQRADLALYSAKRMGRDVIWVDTPGRAAVIETSPTPVDSRLSPAPRPDVSPLNFGLPYHSMV